MRILLDKGTVGLGSPQERWFAGLLISISYLAVWVPHHYRRHCTSQETANPRGCPTVRQGAENRSLEESDPLPKDHTNQLSMILPMALPVIKGPHKCRESRMPVGLGRRTAPQGAPGGRSRRLTYRLQLPYQNRSSLLGSTLAPADGNEREILTYHMY